jgi:hypothetical protein
VGFWVYKQEMGASSWEMLVKKLELNPQKLAFSSGDTAQIVKDEEDSGDESDSVCLIGTNTGDSKISGMKWLIG